MGKNNKKGNNSKKQEVAKQNEEVNNAEIVENVEQVEQAEIEPNEAAAGVSETAPETPTIQSDSDGDKKGNRKFTKKNGKTERLVKSVEYILEDAIEFADGSDKSTEEQVAILKESKQIIMDTLHEAADEIIKKENDEIAEQIKADNKEKSDKHKAEKAHDEAIKTLMNCGLTKEAAERLLEENSKKATESEEPTPTEE